MSNESSPAIAADFVSPTPVEVLSQAADICTQACTCGVDSNESTRKVTSKQRVTKLVAMYATMVVVSTLAIYFLEHASVLSAFRTALVAAVGKTVAATWVSSFFH